MAAVTAWDDAGDDGDESDGELPLVLDEGGKPKSFHLPSFEAFKIQNKRYLVASMLSEFLPNESASFRIIKSLSDGLEAKTYRTLIGTLFLVGEHLGRSGVADPFALALLTFLPFLLEHRDCKDPGKLKCASLPFAVAMYQLKNGGKACTMRQAMAQAAAMGLPAHETMEGTYDALKPSSKDVVVRSLHQHLHVNRLFINIRVSMRLFCKCCNGKRLVGNPSS